jgi:hypothetical protein
MFPSEEPITGLGPQGGQEVVLMLSISTLIFNRHISHSLKAVENKGPFITATCEKN